jgi:hypothetical protein
MDAVEDYARRWIKREVDQDPELEYHLSEILMLNDIQITSDYMSRWVVLKRRVGAVTTQRVLKVLFYVNILQCFFVVENFTTWRLFVFLNQFDLNLFMITTENSSIFRLLTKESMLLTSATFLIEKRS